MLLIVSNKTDLATDFLILRLHEREIPFVRINTEDYLSKWEVNFYLCEDEAQFYIQFDDGRKVSGDMVTGAYIRQPRLPSVDVVSDHKVFADREIGEALRSLWRFVDDKIWLNPPHNILRASNKPEQLAMARSLGFRIPATCVTSNTKIIREFFKNNGGDIVAKAVKHGFLYEDGNARVAPTQVVKEEDVNDLDRYAALPLIFQRRIEKVYDIRATIVGKRIYAAAIYSQDFDETKVDWRLSDHHKIKLRYEKINLPLDISELCISLTSQLNLRYSAIDLVLSKSGDYYFLEANPNGQWAWIEQLTGYPIRDSIIDELSVKIRDA